MKDLIEPVALLKNNLSLEMCANLNAYIECGVPVHLKGIECTYVIRGLGVFKNYYSVYKIKPINKRQVDHETDAICPYCGYKHEELIFENGWGANVDQLSVQCPVCQSDYEAKTHKHSRKITTTLEKVPETLDINSREGLGLQKMLFLLFSKRIKEDFENLCYK